MKTFFTIFTLIAIVTLFVIVYKRKESKMYVAPYITSRRFSTDKGLFFYLFTCPDDYEYRETSASGTMVCIKKK